MENTGIVTNASIANAKELLSKATTVKEWNTIREKVLTLYGNATMSNIEQSGYIVKVLGKKSNPNN